MNLKFFLAKTNFICPTTSILSIRFISRWVFGLKKFLKISIFLGIVKKNYESKPIGASLKTNKKTKNNKEKSDTTALCNTSSNISTTNGSKKDEDGKTTVETPKGIGETTYQEWFSKVNNYNN